MPAGGTWVTQNKRRPGAYINFVSVPKPVGSLGSRGTVAVALPMTWGDESNLIKLTGAELLSGASLSKVGCTAFDTEESLPFRAALAGCFTAYLFRSDQGATRASAVLRINDLVVNAKYTGTTGNSLVIAITANDPTPGTSKVQILFKALLKETFYVTTLNDFRNLESEWVNFVVASTPGSQVVPVTAGTPLAGAVNGAVTAARYPLFFAALEHKNFQCLAINTTDAAIAPLIKAQTELWREQRGKKVQAVVYNYPVADYEGIISVNQGFTTQVDQVGIDLFPVWVASMTAGSNVNQSLTASVIDGAQNIINPILEDEIENALKAGRFVLSYRQDGAVCVEQDINTLHTFTVDKGYAFSKNRVVRCLDEIGNTTALIFNRNYSGKVDNNDIGRKQYKGELISMVDQLVEIDAVTNFDGAADITVLPGISVDSVVVDLTIQPVDSMEKLYMTVNVDA